MKLSKQDQFLHFYEPVHDQFERFCRARVYGFMDYRDLMNETLLKAFEKLEELNNQDAFFSFLCGISVRILSNQNRKIQESSYSSGSKYHVDANAKTELDAELYFLYEALSRLKSDQRECIVLFEIAGFSIKEIAEMQNAGESAIKQRLKRGREKLAGIMTYESDLIKKEIHHG